MTRPSVSADFATDAAYTHGPVIGQPNKSQPSAGELAEGFIPTEPIPGDYLNWLLNNVGKWLGHFDGAFGDGLFGTGTDGDLTFDGAATVLGIVPVANVYTLPRHLQARNIIMTGNAKIKEAGYFIWCRETCDLTGSSVAGGGIITADGSDGAAGAGAGGAGGAGCPSGAFAGGAAGGAGGGLGNGTAGTAVTDSNGGAGGAGGTGGGSNGGAGGTSSAPATTHGQRIPSLVGFLMGVTGSGPTATGLLTALRGGAGGGGGAGNAGVAWTGGGGGGGAGVGGIYARNLKLKTASDIRAKGGNGGQPSAPGAAGGGGGGGDLAICYATLSVADSSAFSNATNCPGGTGITGVFSGVAGSHGTLYEFNLGNTNGVATITTTQRGVVPFSSVGSGAGTDYQDVTLTPAMPNASYEIELTMGLDDDVSGAPQVSYRLKTTGGFRIRPNAPFDGEVSWVATPA